MTEKNRMKTWSRWFCWGAAAVGLGGGWVLAGTDAGTRVLIDLDAMDFTTGATYWRQRTETTGIAGHFIPRGSPTRQVVGGAPAVVFDGDGDAFIGPVTTAALHGAGAPHTVEVWAFQGNVREQEALVSWGRRGGPDSTFVGYRYGADPDFGAVAMWSFNESGYATLPAPGRWHYLVFSYDGKRQAVYVDGRLDHEKVVGRIDPHDTLPILLGAEMSARLELEGKFTHLSGALGRVRISSGAMGAAEVGRRHEEQLAGFPGLVGSPLVRLPRHRFSFARPVGKAVDGTVVADAIGGMQAVVRGDGARFTGSGLRLPGGSSSSAAYIDFPNHMVSGQRDVTLELWVTQEAALDWCRILSVGTNRSGEIVGPGGGFFGSETLTLFGNVGAAPVNRFARSAGRLLNGGPDRDPADYPEGELGVRFHHAIVYDHELSEWRWYRNGVLMEVIPDAEGPMTLDDVNVWLGRSEFSADNNFQGVFHEVRLHNRVLAEAELFGSYQTGPGAVKLAEPVVSGQWAEAEAGVHSWVNTAESDRWGTGQGGPHPDGVGAVATVAVAGEGSQSLMLDTGVTLGALNLGHPRGVSGFKVEARGGAALTLDAGRHGPACVVQLPGSPPNEIAVPLVLAGEVEVANLTENPLVLSGRLGGGGDFIKTGPGPVVLTDPGSDFPGAFRIFEGAVVIDEPDSAGILSKSRFTIGSNGVLGVRCAKDFTTHPQIDGSGRLVHFGSGRLALGASSNLTMEGVVDAGDEAGVLTLQGRVDGAALLRTDSVMELAEGSYTRIRDYVAVGYEDGGELVVRDGAALSIGGGQGALNVGDVGVGQGVMRMEGGTVFWRELFVGKHAGTSGVLIQSGGDLTRRGTGGVGESRIGGAFEGTDETWGAMRMEGGVFSSDGDLQVGAYGAGLLEIEDGSAAIGGFLSVGRFRDGGGRPSHGVVDVRGGRLAATGAERLLIVGEEGNGALTVRGGGQVVCGNKLVIGAGKPTAAGVGTVSLLEGGVLTAMGVGQFNDALASGVLYFDGGELRAAGDNPVFLDHLDSVVVGPGGAVMHTDGFEVGVGQSLVAPAEMGVAEIPVLESGEGYLAPPLVLVDGGAVALAVVEAGRVTRVDVVYPGMGYTSPPDVRILGGGDGRGLHLGVPVLKPNRGGGLTKTGYGSLVLSGTNSHAGPTRVLQGELRIDGDHGAACGLVEVSPGAILSGTGVVGGSVEVASGAMLTPGQPGGRFKVVGDLVLGGMLTTAIGGGLNGSVEVGGTLDLRGARLAVTASGGPPGARAHVLASYGRLAGRFEASALPPGFKLDYNYRGRNQVALVPAGNGDGE